MVHADEPAGRKSPHVLDDASNPFCHALLRIPSANVSCVSRVARAWTWVCNASGNFRVLRVDTGGLRTLAPIANLGDPLSNRGGLGCRNLGVWLFADIRHRIAAVAGKRNPPARTRIF